MPRFIRLQDDIRSGVGVALVAGLMLAALLVVVNQTAPDGPRRSPARQTVSVSETSSMSPVGGVPVLCYHFLHKNVDPLQFVKILGSVLGSMPLLDRMDVWMQTTAEFEKEMAYLRDNGYTAIDLDDLIAWQRGVARLPEKSVVITFDDGDRSALTLAMPILKAYGMKATLFIVTDNVGKEWDRVEGLNWNELRVLHRSGMFSIESHTNAFHYKVKTRDGRMPVLLAASKGLFEFPGGRPWREVVFEDLVESRRQIRQQIGVDARYVAWPYGHGDSTLDSLAVAAGFDGVCTLRAGLNPSPAIADTPAPGSPVSAAPFLWLFNPYAARSGMPAAALYGDEDPWEWFEIRRYTITARTSMRTFDIMLTPMFRP